jgi:putative salt-induced outer membrane protein
MMKTPKFMLALLATVAMATTAHASYKNETEVGANLVSGNSKSETYTAKTKSVWALDENIFTGTGSYLKTSTAAPIVGSVETGNAWSAGLRYDRALSDSFSIFVGHVVEGNRFAGFGQKYSTDVGAKYTIFSTKDTSAGYDNIFSWISEFGYRYIHTNFNTGLYAGANALRLYTELNKTISKSASTKFWVEYVPQVSDFANQYQVRSELSLSMIMSDMFSVKMAYLADYKNTPAAVGAERLDTQFTTSLVANLSGK